jgi:regulator of sirC expression with transglutaminase-like and TPR domain
MKSFIVALFLFSSILIAQSLPIIQYTGQTIWDLPNVKEENIDVGLWALILAREYDSTINVQKYSDSLDFFAQEVREMLAGRTSDRDKFAAVRMFIYESGKWNAFHRFDYDLDDPFGKKLENQLLSTFIDSRNGNCVSMPTLFYSLMRRVDKDIPVSIVPAPLHLFCRIRDRQTGDVWNFETTNGQTARNVWYIETMNTSTKMIESGLYMREYSSKEFLAELICILAHKYRDKGEYRKALEYANLALMVCPQSSSNIIQKCALSAELSHQLKEKNNIVGKLSDEETKEYKQYLADSEYYYKKLQELGWRPETQEERQQYLQQINEEKKRAQKQ